MLNESDDFNIVGVLAGKRRLHTTTSPTAKVVTMTKNETFKILVRVRMEKTGERYAAARRAVAHETTSQHTRTWVSPPETSNESVMRNTGKSWNEWCDIIDDAHVSNAGHTAIATFVGQHFDVSGWWAQGITVGYERICGLRLPHEMADGTFTANKSKTVNVDAETLRRLLLTDDDRRDLLPQHRTVLRSKPTSKTLRFEIESHGVAVISIAAVDGRSKITIQHEKLRSFDDVAEWKFFWTEWLHALNDNGEDHHTNHNDTVHR